MSQQMSPEKTAVMKRLDQLLSAAFDAIEEMPDPEIHNAPELTTVSCYLEDILRDIGRAQESLCQKSEGSR